MEDEAIYPADEGALAAALVQYGWDEDWERAFRPHRAQGFVPARVTAVWSDGYEVAAAEGLKPAEISGRLRYATLYAAKRPTIGDWVACMPNPDGPCLIAAVLPRRTCLQRQEADGIASQVVGANIDVCLIMQALAGDFNPARVDRYLAMVLGGGAAPAVVLTKADLLSAEEVAGREAALAHIADRVRLFVVSAVTGQGLAELTGFLVPRRTYAAMGSSGVGKSTLLNLLSGQERMATGAVRADDQKGRHVTTHRQLFALPGGALFVDTPGMRELALFSADSQRAYTDIQALAKNCQFNNCTHAGEPGCAVRQAIEDGTLPRERWESYVKLQHEESFMEQKQILLRKRLSNARKKRRKVHYKDYIRGGLPGRDDRDD